MQSITQTRTSGLAIAALVLGIVSIIGGAIFIAPTVLAIVFGHIASSQCKKDSALGGRGMAIAGYVTGYISIVYIIGVLAAMAIPAYQKVRQTSLSNAGAKSSSYEENARTNDAADAERLVQESTARAQSKWPELWSGRHRSGFVQYVSDREKLNPKFMNDHTDWPERLSEEYTDVLGIRKN